MELTQEEKMILYMLLNNYLQKVESYLNKDSEEMKKHIVIITNLKNKFKGEA